MPPKKTKGGAGKGKGANKDGRAQEPATPTVEKINSVPPKVVDPEPAVSPQNSASPLKSNGVSDIVPPSSSQNANGTAIPEPLQDSEDLGTASHPSQPIEVKVPTSTPWATSSSNGGHPSFDDSRLSSSIVRGSLRPSLHLFPASEYLMRILV